MILLSRITLNLEFTTPAIFPYWMGSAFRGGFGQTLKRAVCPDSKRECQSCEIRDKCLFFYTYMKEKSRRGYAPPIKPIILIPPFFGKKMRIEKEPRLSIEALFFGDFTKYLPHVILAMSLLGKRGLYAQRYEGLNRFEIKEIGCSLSQRIVYDGETIFLKNLTVIDIKDLDPLKTKRARIGFKTPFTGREFPPEPSDLLNGIRNRLIRFVNEYGNGENIPEIGVSGRVEGFTRHYHRLERRSRRSDKRVFHSYTGVVEYCFEELDRMAAWILGLGFHIGCGPDASFGCGFLQKMWKTGAYSDQLGYAFE
jgi:CRISPR/Cas system endoribonuclease Cas6 (RAMP superfamily)